MSKVFGNKTCYVPVRDENSRIVVSYGYQERGDNATWWELYFPKNGKVTIDTVKKAVWDDINKQTDEKILSGFTWSPDGGETSIHVWLSEENQRNFSEAQRIALMMPEAILPVTFKLGEGKDGSPIYHEFTTAEELTGFYLSAVAYINQCLAEGWQRKDGINWEPYQNL